ncbi:MAG: 30S ribosomal protein S16 [Anaerolineae bacterium]|nr:30S ribosomal protein S16 [Anaerolineae bacterium]
MVRIRLRRVGRKKQASFRVVAADKESPRDGRFLENLGFYNPRTEPATITLKEDRIYDWLSKGAQPSESAEQIMRTAGLLERFERFKAGEDVAKLMEEAAAAEASRNISEKTRRDAPVGKPKEEKKEEPKAEEKVEAKAEEKAAPKEEEKEEPKAEEKVETKAEEKAAPKAEKKEEPKAEEKVEAKAEAKEEKAKPKKEDSGGIPKAAFKISVEELGLASNVTTKLTEEGFANIGDLMTQLEKDPEVILGLSGIGPKALETITEAVAGYTFPE